MFTKIRILLDVYPNRTETSDVEIVISNKEL